jgi:enoyl-CoA hydratase/carnithine racemase
VIEAALLPRLIGWGRTSQLLYTGDTIDATQAAAWGLIEQSVDDGELDRRVEQLVDSICNAGAKAIRAQKALLLQWEKLPLEQAVERGIEVFAQAYQSDEPERLMQHFLHRKTAI